MWKQTLKESSLSANNLIDLFCLIVGSSCVCVCDMHMHVFSCFCVWVLACYSTYMTGRVQPLVLVLVFGLVWDKVSYSSPICHCSWPMNFHGPLVSCLSFASCSKVTLIIDTCSHVFLHESWVSDLSPWVKCKHFTYYAMSIVPKFGNL